jgi:hypothetical protein
MDEGHFDLLFSWQKISGLIYVEEPQEKEYRSPDSESNRSRSEKLDKIFFNEYLLPRSSA